MRIGYRCIGKILSPVARPFAVTAGLVILPFSALSVKFERVPVAKNSPAVNTLLSRQVSRTPATLDPRTLRLKRFLSSLHCPVAAMADDFVHAADDNHLDWRLLPSIAVIESGGGKAYINNNIFGWGYGGPIPFPSIRTGLNLVAFKLAQSPLYRDLDIADKLRHYNPDETYPSRVMDVMHRISPIVDLTPIQHLVHRQSEYVYLTE
jgi:hypothetical protein